MAIKKRLLTKSKFKTGHECPSKLFYLDKPEYGNTKMDNAFLEALAEGGFQVGELAKIYHPGGIEITERDPLKAVAETVKHLSLEKVILFEPAIQFENFLVRIDVLVKSGNHVQLIEVKAKSIDPAEEEPFYNRSKLRRGVREINSKWEPYIGDIAFQNHVLQCAYPNFKITSHLMLADKSATASVDGINQRFVLSSPDNSKYRVAVAAGTSEKNLGDRLLTKICVDGEIETIFNRTYLDGMPFKKYVEYLAKTYLSGKQHPPVVGQTCKNCEYRIDAKSKSKGQISGFEKCWQTAMHLKPKDFSRPLVFDLWNFRKSAGLIGEGSIFVDQLTEEDIDPEPREGESGLSNSERQWLQAEKIIKADMKPFFDIQGLRSEMTTWNFPLHFIDFETSMVAIPFHAGRRPYEQIAFQFSHHTVSKDGKIEHRTEYINRQRGSFPNFDFVRALKAALSQDEGTIFRFAAHENTVLCQILEQLERSNEKDRDALISWVRTITKAPDRSVEKWEGHRNMVDMRELVLRYYYHPFTEGSNSIKDVLPAILRESNYLQDRYSRPIYGSAEGIASKNFNNWLWIKKDEAGNILDPYSLLDPVFADMSATELDGVLLMLDEDHRIADGGAAMTAYARMQFTEMSEAECESICKALLKYCELDTFAMVMIYEYWKHEIENVGRKKRVA
ncbi:MAG: DUF2779 domain-containing protein [Bdellovibrionaceae bacterium]|nr:DUF2779 domain-containing protein [Pseudobdellovibrionaceae bacterium]